MFGSLRLSSLPDAAVRSRACSDTSSRGTDSGHRATPGTVGWISPPRRSRPALLPTVRSFDAFRRCECRWKGTALARSCSKPSRNPRGTMSVPRTLQGQKQPAGVVLQDGMLGDSSPVSFVALVSSSEEICCGRTCLQMCFSSRRTLNGRSTSDR
jgi:hypothetical protein